MLEEQWAAPMGFVQPLHILLTSLKIHRSFSPAGSKNCGDFSPKVGLHFASQESNSRQKAPSLPTKASCNFLFLAVGYQAEINGAENQMPLPNT